MASLQGGVRPWWLQGSSGHHNGVNACDLPRFTRLTDGQCFGMELPCTNGGRLL